MRAVERLDARSSTIVVISDHVRGVRLSEVLAGARKRSIPLEYNAAAWLIRQLVSAIAALHDSGPGVCHGAIAPERLVVTPDGRLVVVEYVLGPALEEMHFSWERYWRELGIALPRPIGLSRFDQSADVTQMAAVALALLLGRPLAADEYPHKISDVLDSATARQVDGSDPLPAALRTWLRRALHIEPRAAFASAIEAQTELDRVLDVQDTAGRLALRSFLSRYAAAMALERQMAAQPRPEPAPVERAEARRSRWSRPPSRRSAPSRCPWRRWLCRRCRTSRCRPRRVRAGGVLPHRRRCARGRGGRDGRGARNAALRCEPVRPPRVSDDDAEADDDAAAFEPPSSVTPFPAPAPFAPPPSPLLSVASVTPFTPRAAAAELRMPVPESGPWASPGPDTWRPPRSRFEGTRHAPHRPAHVGAGTGSAPPRAQPP